MGDWNLTGYNPAGAPPPKGDPQTVLQNYMSEHNCSEAEAKAALEKMYGKPQMPGMTENGSVNVCYRPLAPYSVNPQMSLISGLFLGLSDLFSSLKTNITKSSEKPEVSVNPEPPKVTKPTVSANPEPLQVQNPTVSSVETVQEVQGGDTNVEEHQNIDAMENLDIQRPPENEEAELDEDVLEKVNEMKDKGKAPEEIAMELHEDGISDDLIPAYFKAAGLELPERGPGGPGGPGGPERPE